MPSRSAGVFLSYRRSDSAGHTGRIFDRLTREFGRDHVFMDVDSIAPGTDFVDRIEEMLGASSVVLVVIGPGWLDASSTGSDRRLDDERDHVRREIEIALRSAHRVIPVCVRGSHMPGEGDLPEAVRGLGRRSAISIDDSRFDDDVTHLVGVVADVLDDRSSAPIASRKSGNVPAPTSSVIGVEETVSRIRSSLRSSRLVTLTGAGGCGKTTIALMVARAVADRWAAGTWFVPLASASGNDAVASVVAATLGVELEASETAAETISRTIGDRELLLVLDNCEHVLDPVADLLDVLLSHCFGVRVLTTSRESLGMAGESVVPIPTLASPPERASGPGDALAFSSVQLFIDRARTADPDYALEGRDLDEVASICRTLDGLPLAIELAAARVRSVPVRELAESLRANVAEATGSRRGGPVHHRTITAAIDWSHRLLDDRLRVGFDRLAVFRGGFDVEAALAVAELSHLDLGELMDRSLLVSASSPPGSRFRLLEPLRQYAQERLATLGQVAETSDAHVAWVRTLTEQAEEGLWGAAGSAWMQRLRAEWPNIEVAMERCIDTEDPRTIVEILTRLFLLLDELPNHQRWLDPALAHEALSPDPCLMTRARAVRCFSAIMRADRPGERKWRAEALRASRACNDPSTQLLTMYVVGVGMRLSAEYADAIAAHSEGALLAEDLADLVWSANHRYCLGLALLSSGAAREAEPPFRAALEHATMGGNAIMMSAASAGLGRIALQEDRLDDAERLFLAAVFDQGASPSDAAVMLGAVSDVSAARGDEAAVLEACRQGIDLLEGLGTTVTGFSLAARVASALVRMGRTPEGAELFGSLSALGWSGIMMGPWGPDARIEMALAAARGDEQAAPSWRRGEVEGPESVVDRARALIDDTIGA